MLINGVIHDICPVRDDWERLFISRKGRVYEVLCDVDIHEQVKNYAWFISKAGYAFSRMGKGRKGKWVYLHRYVIEAKQGDQVDHIDQNKLNNLRANLRLCTSQQNKWNIGLTKRNSSGYKGISWDKKNKKWEANIRIDRKNHKIGRFDSKELAALAYNEVVEQHRGEFAVMNEVSI